MRRVSWCTLVALIVMGLGPASAQVGLRDAVDGLVRQFGGDVDAAIDVVSGFAEMAPGQLEALRANEEAVTVIGQAARLAGVPQVAVDAVLDPSAALDTVASYSDDLQSVLRALEAVRDGAPVAAEPLEGATLAQAPPQDAVPTPSPPSPSPAPAPVPPPADLSDVRSPLADALGFATWLELALVIISWLTITWLFFFVLWRVLMPANPFLAVRLAYTLSVLAALTYLALVFWPKFFTYALPEEVSYVPYVAAGVIAVIMMIVVWASYRSQTDLDEGA